MKECVVRGSSGSRKKAAHAAAAAQKREEKRSGNLLPFYRLSECRRAACVLQVQLGMSLGCTYTSARRRLWVLLLARQPFTVYVHLRIGFSEDGDLSPGFH